MSKIFLKELENLRELIDKQLYQLLETDKSYQDKVYESIKYSLFSGGKRLRPIICIKTFNIFNGGTGQVLPYASAIEMIHTYSLIHDDLPSMDDDDLRRGKSSNHIVFGEALAILSGDGLLNLAYETMLDDMLSSSRDPIDFKRRARAMKIIAKCSGINGMIGGQVVDLFCNYEDMSRDKLEFMYNAKTSALFEASVLSGAILAGAKEWEIEVMHNFAKYIGLAYQIKDDILDKDEDKDKFTFFNLDSESDVNKKMKLLTEDALKELDKLDNRDTSFLKDLTYFLLERKK